MNAAGLRASWMQVAVAGDAAAKHFYATLFLLAPDIRGMFPASMTAQNDRLLAALGHIVSHVDDPTVLGQFAGQLGADHRRFDVKPRHYSVVGHALLSTLEEFLGAGFTPALREDWRTAYQTITDLMLAGATRAGRHTPPWWTGKVLTTQRRTAEVLVFTVLPDYQIDYLPGQSLPVLGPFLPGWRFLSPANAPRPDGILEFHLRAVGAVSTSIVTRLRPGDQVKLGTPVGVALTPPSGTGPVVMIAGGTGVAPLRAVLEAMAQGQQPTRSTTLVYGAPTPTGLYDHPALSLLAARAGWLTYLPTVEAGRWPGHVGRAVDTAVTATDWRRAHILVCGSPAMVTTTRHQLSAAGLPADRIHTDEHCQDRYPALTATGGHP